jgi:hypothetical protein
VPMGSPTAGAVASIKSSKAPKNFLHAAEESKPAQNERESKSGVQPMVEKIAYQPSENDRSDKCERKLDRQRGIRGVLLRLFLILRQRFGFVG